MNAEIIYNFIILALLILVYKLYQLLYLEGYITKEGEPLMDEIKRRNMIFVNYIYHLYKDDKDHKLSSRAKFLKKRYDPEVIREHFPNVLNDSTSYVENKGEEIGYCLKSKKGLLEDINTMMYVSIHELTHIYLYDINQHPKEFFQNFKYLLQHAVDLKLYNPVDYKKYPIEYCGMKLDSNVLFQ